MWRENENQLCRINVVVLVENGRIHTLRRLNGTAWIVLIYSPLAENPSIFLVYFYFEQTVHFSPVCKCAIKELVASNHRMWTKAKRGQLFTRQPLILRWSWLLQPCPPPPPPPPPPWRMRGGNGICTPDSIYSQTHSWKISTLQRWSNVGWRLPTERYIFKTWSPENKKKLNTTGVVVFFFIFIFTVSASQTTGINLPFVFLFLR